MYIVRFANLTPEMRGLWDGPAWSRADILDITNFRPESSSYHPETSARLLYDDEGIHGLFRVRDRFVRCVHAKYGDPVYKDSCVEFFVKPKTDKGYFNFEFNCGGALLCSYITNPERTAEGFREFILLPEPDGNKVGIFHSLPQIVDPELSGPMIWMLEFFIPFTLLEKYVGPVGDPRGKEWTANFYKCGDETSHPHWASWQPVPVLNFHMPEHFGTIRFENR